MAVCRAVHRETVRLVLSLFFREKAAEHGVRACLVFFNNFYKCPPHLRCVHVVRAGSWWDMGASVQIPSWFC